MASFRGFPGDIYSRLRVPGHAPRPWTMRPAWSPVIFLQSAAAFFPPVHIKARTEPTATTCGSGLRKPFPPRSSRALLSCIAIAAENVLRPFRMSRLASSLRRASRKRQSEIEERQWNLDPPVDFLRLEHRGAHLEDTGERRPPANAAGGVL